MTIFRSMLTICLAALIAVPVASMAQAAITFANGNNFRELRVNPPLNFTAGLDLLIIAIDVIDDSTGVAPVGALVGAENSVTGEKFFMRLNGPVKYSVTIPYMPARALGTWIIGVTSDVGSATSLVSSFGTGLGTGPIPGVDNLAIVPGAEPSFSWNLPPGLPGLNDGNIDRIRARLRDSNGRRILDDRFDPTATATSYATPSGVVTHNGAYVGQILIEGLTPFDRSRTFETFLVETVGTGGAAVTPPQSVLFPRQPPSQQCPIWRG